MSKLRDIPVGQTIPDWALKRPKSFLQATLDLLAAPFRMILLPDHVCERLHVTSLRGERFAAVLPRITGRLLDIGAGDNSLVRLYKAKSAEPAASDSVGTDIFDWGEDCVILERSDNLPFPDNSFDTVSFVACLNHIPERAEALREALRILRPGGSVLITMIGPFIGKVGHALWWYSEDKHRDVDEDEEMGMSNSSITTVLKQSGFVNIRTDTFVYGLNNLFVADKPTGV